MNKTSYQKRLDEIEDLKKDKSKLIGEIHELTENFDSEKSQMIRMNYGWRRDFSKALWMGGTDPDSGQSKSSGIFGLMVQDDKGRPLLTTEPHEMGLYRAIKKGWENFYIKFKK